MYVLYMIDLIVVLGLLLMYFRGSLFRLNSFSIISSLY